MLIKHCNDILFHSESLEIFWAGIATFANEKIWGLDKLSNLLKFIQQIKDRSKNYTFVFMVPGLVFLPFITLVYAFVTWSSCYNCLAKPQSWLNPIHHLPHCFFQSSWNWGAGESPWMIRVTVNSWSLNTLVSLLTLVLQWQSQNISYGITSSTWMCFILLRGKRSHVIEILEFIRSVLYT